MLLSVLVAGTSQSPAAILTFWAPNLSGLAQWPPNVSPGTGWAIVTFDDIANTMRVQAAFSGLVGIVIFSQIRVINGPGDTVTSNPIGPVATPLPGFPTGVFAGVYDQTVDMTLASSFDPRFLAAAGGVAEARTALFTGISSGRAYLEIRTPVFLDGEIRSFFEPVPEPGTLGMAALALCGLLWRLRRSG